MGRKTTLRKLEAREKKEIFSLNEAANYLGVSYGPMRQILDSGELPYRQTKRRIFISKTAIDKWASFQTSDPVDTVTTKN